MRIIYHVDVNSAFLSWEAVYRMHHLGAKLDLRTIPAAVGGDQAKRHGIILAKSIPCKRYGVQTGEPVVDAKRKCPNLVIVPPNYELYNKSSKAFIAVLKRYTDKVDQYSIDEAFLDMTGYTNTPEETAVELKDTIKRELGFTVNVGVSENKLLAKMASELRKPDMVHTLWRYEIPEKMWPLPVSELFYVGRASGRKLDSFGIKTIGDLAKFDVRYLKAVMKSHGVLIHEYANGLDDSEVIIEPPANKGYGNSLTTPKDVCTVELAKLYLLSLSETVSARLRADGVKIRVVAISLRDYNLKFHGHQIKLQTPTDLTCEIYDAACQCLKELWDGIPLRHLGIHTTQVTAEAGRQMSFFDKTDYEKQKKAEQAIDQLRKRFGRDVIMRASFLPSVNMENHAIDHMGGGISREKRSVDYSKEDII